MLVVVDRNAWVHRSIAAEASADGLEVVSCTTARGALSLCCALEPVCVVSELALPDHDGLWLVSQLRAQPSEVAAAPFVMTSSDYQEETRIQALRTGADVFLPKPYNPVELIVQVRALLMLSARIKLHRAPILPVQPSAPDGHERAIIGDLDRISVATALSSLELDKRSGHLILAGGPEGRRRLQLTLASGTLIGGLSGGVPFGALEAMREALRWSGKRFEFWPSERIAPPSGATSIHELVLAAVRLDEARPSGESAGKEAGTRTATGSSPRNKAAALDLDGAWGPADEAHLHSEGSRGSTPRPRTSPASTASSAAWAVARAFEAAHHPPGGLPPPSARGLTPKPGSVIAPVRPPSGTNHQSSNGPPSSPGYDSSIRRSDPGRAPLTAPGRRLVESVSPSSRPDPRADVPERPKVGGLAGLLWGRTDDPEPPRRPTDPGPARVPIDDDSPTIKTRRR